MSVEIKTDEDVVTSFLSGEIDHHVALPIREKTDAAIISAHPKRVVLDFSGVTFMDSSGIGLVMGDTRYARVWEPHSKFTACHAMHIR